MNVEETICRLVDNGIAVFVAVMATPRNVDDLFEIAEWSHEHADFVRAFSELDPPNLFDDGCICCENKAFCHSCIARGLMSGMGSESCWWYRNKVPAIVKQDLGLEV